MSRRYGAPNQGGSGCSGLLKLGCFSVVAISVIGTIGMLAGRKPAPGPPTNTAPTDIKAVIAEQLADDAPAESKYLNTMVTVTGVVGGVRPDTLRGGTLLPIHKVQGNHIVNATFKAKEDKVRGLELGSAVKVRGRLTAATGGTRTVVMAIEDAELLP